jgi:hypothetical protein
MAPPHEPIVLQVMSQLSAAEQSTPPVQLAVPLHTTRHGWPAGHTTWSLHESACTHSMTQVSPSHRVQSG